MESDASLESNFSSSNARTVSEGLIHAMLHDKIRKLSLFKWKT
jgi:hypothetical protein